MSEVYIEYSWGAREGVASSSWRCQRSLAIESHASGLWSGVGILPVNARQPVSTWLMNPVMIHPNMKSGSLCNATRTLPNEPHQRGWYTCLWHIIGRGIKKILGFIHGNITGPSPCWHFDWIILCCKTVLCTIGYLVASVAFSHKISVALPFTFTKIWLQIFPMSSERQNYPLPHTHLRNAGLER
jgi:hypothetical protein